MNDYAKQVRKNVETHGFHVTYVSSEDSPSFCYSTGIFQSFGIPELFVSALPPQLSHELITQYAKRHSAEGPPVDKRIAAIDERFDYYLINVDPDRLVEYALASFRFYGEDPFETLQLIYPDTEMRFPHEPGYDYDQEILGSFG